MAVSAFKSSSRRSTSASSSSNSAFSTSGKDNRQVDDSISSKKVTMRRSRSVSAFSRSRLDDIPVDFSNSRDNPLFWSNNSPPSDEVRSINLECDGIRAGNLKSMSYGGVEDTRGRTVSRNCDSGSNVSGSRKIAGRSLSRFGGERRDRSVSRVSVSSQSFVKSESEAERDNRFITKSSNRKTPTSVVRGRREVGLVRSSSDTLQQSKGLKTRSIKLSPFDATVSCNLEDRLSTTSSLSEAEERTFKAVCEQMESVEGDHLQGSTSTSDVYDIIQYEVRRAIQDIHNDLVNSSQSSPNAITSSNMDIPPELVNPGAVELVMDLRSEYTKKLEQSQEQARKLRADLAVEEQRGLELSRILREVILAPKPSMRRKASIERRKMSKRLTDDALAYFDECVSISTFDDGSDFSSLEEALPIHQVSSTIQGSTLGNFSVIDHDDLAQTAYSSAVIEDCVSPSIPIKLGDGKPKPQFSFTSKAHETFGIKRDIEKYMQKCENDGNRSQVINIKHRDMDDVNLHKPTESLLFDRLHFRNRLESGSILLCGVSSATRSSYFASII